MPRVDNETTEDLDADELARLVQAIEDEPNIQAANFMRLALFTGMRRGELFKLEWKDVDFERGFIHSHHPKGGKSRNWSASPTCRRPGRPTASPATRARPGS